MNGDINVHMFIKHKETQAVHRLQLKFKGYDQINKFVKELPETLMFLKYERVAQGY